MLFSLAIRRTVFGCSPSVWAASFTFNRGSNPLAADASVIKIYLLFMYVRQQNEVLHQSLEKSG
jgi:hypothetical protein